MKLVAALLATLVAAPAALADPSDRKDPLGDKLLIAGASTFTAAYAPMTVAGTLYAAWTGGDVGFGGRFFTPIVGPFMWANDSAAAFGKSSAFGPIAAVDGVVQVAGIALMLAGGIHRHHVASASTRTTTQR